MSVVQPKNDLCLNDERVVRTRPSDTPILSLESCQIPHQLFGPTGTNGTPSPVCKLASTDRHLARLLHHLHELIQAHTALPIVVQMIDHALNLLIAQRPLILDLLRQVP